MQNIAPVQLRQVRDFGQIVNDTFRFLRQNGRTLFGAIAATCIPLALLAGFLVGKTVGDFQQMLVRSRFDGLGDLSGLGLALLGYLGILLVYVQLLAMVNEYIRAYHLGEHHGMRTGDLWRRGASQWPTYFGIAFLTGVITVVGALLCVLPGIWAAIALSLVYVCHAIERTGASDSLTRSYKLIQDRWWETFGLLIVVGLIQAVITMALMLPLTVVSFIVGFNTTFTGFENGDMDGGVGWLSTYTAISTMAQTALNMLTYPIIMVAMALKYFTLVEEKEGAGLRQRLEGFEQA